MHELNLAIFIWQAKLIVILQSLPPRPTCFLLLLLSNPDGSCVLVVLLLKVHRVHGYGKSETLAKYSTVYKHTFILFTDFLRVAQEDQPGDNAARHSPWLHALVSVVRRQVHTRSASLVQSTNHNSLTFTFALSIPRWSQHLLRPAQYLCAHCYVHILHVLGHGSSVPEVSVVEEVPDNSANG